MSKYCAISALLLLIFLFKVIDLLVQKPLLAVKHEAQQSAYHPKILPKSLQLGADFSSSWWLLSLRDYRDDVVLTYADKWKSERSFSFD